MNIDWKKVSQCNGYIYLKGCYIQDVQKANMEISKGRRPMRDKKEFRRHFKYAISLAQKCAYKTGASMEEVLDYFARDARSWWLNHYQGWLGCQFIRNYQKKCL